jgi:hypothetical protein
VPEEQTARSTAHADTSKARAKNRCAKASGFEVSVTDAFVARLLLLITRSGNLREQAERVQAITSKADFTTRTKLPADNAARKGRPLARRYKVEASCTGVKGLRSEDLSYINDQRNQKSRRDAGATKDNGTRIFSH